MEIDAGKAGRNQVLRTGPEAWEAAEKPSGKGYRDEEIASASGLSAPEGVQDFSGSRFLKNPLPVPKRKPHVKMEFDLLDDWDIPWEQEHFDIEISEDDDFDL